MAVYKTLRWFCARSYNQLLCINILIKFQKFENYPNLILNFSGAEIVTIKQESAIYAMSRVVESNLSEAAVIQEDDIEKACLKIKPRTKKSDIDMFRNFARVHGQEIDEDIC